jgi:endonuclease-3 related protein
MPDGRPHRSVATLDTLFQRLWLAFGPQHWWPARSAFEVMVGALLTQATNWRNVEQAIERLRRAKALSPEGLLKLSRASLERCLRPSGYFRQKATRLRRFTRWYVTRYRGRADRMFQTPLEDLRRELLNQHGIGPETADSILLYAGRQPIFVVDAYTRRVFRRHRLLTEDDGYEAIQQFAMRQMRKDVQRYNEFHALLVAVGKRYCHRRDPACDQCPLGDLPRTIERTADGT